MPKYKEETTVKNDIILSKYGSIFVNDGELYNLRGTSILEKYLRVKTGDKVISNPNRTRGFINSKSINGCHYTVTVIFSLIINNGKEILAYLKQLESKILYQLSIGELEVKQKLLNKLTAIYDLLVIIYFFQENVETEFFSDIHIDESFNDKMISASHALKTLDIWDVYATKREMVYDYFHPTIYMPYFIMQKIFTLSSNTNVLFTNITPYDYNPYFDMENDIIEWNSIKNKQYVHDFQLSTLGDVLENMYSKKDLTKYLVILHDKSITSQLKIVNNHLDKQNMRFEIPLTLHVYDKIYDLCGIICQTNYDGGHTVSFIKRNNIYWLFNDSQYSLKVYNDRSKNIFLNNKFTIKDLIADLTSLVSTLIYEARC